MKKFTSIILTLIMMVSMITIVQATDFSGGGYNFVCADGGRYLNVYAGKDADGTNVCVWEKDGSPEQNYTINSVGGSKYKLHPASSSSRVIDVNRGNSYDNPLKPGLNVDLWRQNDAPAQEFYITHVGNNLYKIELAALSGHVLQANSPNKNNGNVTLERYTGAGNQHWKILKNGTQVTEPCSHSKISSKNEKTTVAKKDDNSHTVTTTYDKVCNDCGKTVEANIKKTNTEKHSISNNKCTKCGYEIAVVEEIEDVAKCKHEKTYKVDNSVTYGSTNKDMKVQDDEYHINYYWADEYCSNCQKLLNKKIIVEEKELHTYLNGICTSCLHSKTEETKCNHTNTAKHSSDGTETTISIKDDTQHIITRYYNVWCTDCYTYIKENEIDVTYEEHKFANNICSVCNFKKFIERTAYVYNTDGDNLNMRSSANGSSTIVVKIPAGATLTVTGDAVNGFYPVKYNGKTGYASTAYITFTKPSVNKTAYVCNTDGANLNMRSGANKNASIVTKMPEGCTLTVTGDATNGFYPVKYGNHSGYASSAYVTFTKSTTTNGSNIVSNSKTKQIKSKITAMINGSSYSGTYKSGKRYTGAGQCKGFAQLIFKNLFGGGINSTTPNAYGYKVNYNSNLVVHLGTLVNPTLNETKALLMKARPGDFIQMNYKQGSPHSAIVYETTTSGITVYEANIDGINTISTAHRDWNYWDNKYAISLYTAKGY